MNLPNWLTPFAVCCWVALAVAGFSRLNGYAAGEGEAAAAPSVWPESSVPSKPDCPRVVMFAHPRCPCTRASVAELTRVVEASGVQATVVFWQPDEPSDDEWKQSPTIDVVMKHPLLDHAWDPGGKTHQRFGAITSGHCLVYDAGGALLFTGGITAARGHEGANQGRQMVERILSTARDPRRLAPQGAQPREVLSFPVFGCRISG